MRGEAGAWTMGIRQFALAAKAAASLKASQDAVYRRIILRSSSFSLAVAMRLSNQEVFMDVTPNGQGPVSCKGVSLRGTL
jgi:hypothetical protein